MSKEKRKNRLDKAAGGTVDFIGFHSFADVVPIVGESATPQQQNHSWTPVYIGDDSNVATLFPRILRRDATTKVKALQDLCCYLASENIARPLQAVALQHWTWLYYHKIYYDDVPSVRAAAYLVWVLAAVPRLPKVVRKMVNEYPELAGMLYSCQVDPASETRMAAIQHHSSLPLSTEWPWRRGILDFTTRILSYSRALTMHESLFARASEVSKDLSEANREALEERFERLLGIALETIDFWIRTDSGEARMVNDDEEESVSYLKTWCKTLTNAKASLRRKTYQLITSISVKQSHLLQSKNVDITKMLVQSLSSEREPSNLPTLLETIVALLSQKTLSVDTNIFSKPLIKTFRKACYAAPVQAWGPTLLPLTARFMQSRPPVSIFQSIYDGCDCTFGASDSWNLLVALVECTSFCLLKKQPEIYLTDHVNENGEVKDDIIATAQLWLNVCKQMLSIDPAGLIGLTLTSYEKLKNIVAKFFLQMRDATTQRPNCYFFIIANWFWESGWPSCLTTQNNTLAVAQFVETLHQQLQKVATTLVMGPLADGSALFDPIMPPLQQYFFEILKPYQESSSAVPSSNSYEMFRQILTYCGAERLFEDGSLERFVTNDLLRWIIIHTSTLSTIEQSRRMVRLNFHLLWQTLASFENDRRNIVWESVLREIIAAKCKLNWLAEGLLYMAEKSQQESLSWISCSTLDRFVLELVGLDSNAGEVPSLDETRLNFFRVCFGLSINIDDLQILVRENVIFDLIELECVACDQGISQSRTEVSALLQALLELTERRGISDFEKVDKILFASWHRGGDLFLNKIFTILAADLGLCLQLRTRRSEAIERELETICIMSKDNCEEIMNLARVWATRACFLVKIFGHFTSDSNVTSPSLGLIHLDNIERWKMYSEAMYLCMMSLFQIFENPNDCLSLILASRESALHLLSTILLQISGAAVDVHKASLPRSRRDRCARLIEALGSFRSVDDLAHNVICSVLATVEETMKGADSDTSIIRRGISVLSQLLEGQFCRLSPPTLNTLDAATVNEGTWLWYNTDPEILTKRDLVEIVEVHYDAQAGYFYTVRFERDGKLVERQTVLERLSRDEDYDNDRVTFETISFEEKTKRLILSTSLAKITVQHIFHFEWNTMVSELVNVICCHVGGVEGKSPNDFPFNLIRVVQAIENLCCKALEEKKIESAIDMLWKLSLALGFGLNVPSSSWVCHALRYDVNKCTTAIVMFYESETIGVNNLLDIAVLAWLSTFFACILNRDLYRVTDVAIDASLSLLFKIASNMLSNTEELGFREADAVIIRAMHQSFLLHVNQDVFTSDLLVEAESVLECLIGRFSASWEDNVVFDRFGFPNPFWKSDSEFSKLLELSNVNKTIKKIMVSASGSKNSETLCSALFIVSKRYSALQLLLGVASSRIAQFEKVDIDIGTTRRLKEWVSLLEDEEKEEVEEDIDIVSRWLPRRIMQELEIWGEEVFEETDDLITIGRLLMWLCVLQFIEVVAPEDFRHRPAFASYLSSCGAAYAALNLALLNVELVNNSKQKIAPSLLDVELLQSDSVFLTLSHISSLVLFRTIEVLPSLSRRWWEECCPKVYVNDVQAFLEKYVAPEILKRELERIRNSTKSFGPMNVVASVLSREVKATYVQDDFKLSVLIKLPPAFPFRSAQVDCSKTLGVPQERWKRWSLQITLMLNNQGGTLQDALLLWKGNVDKEFDGVEPCPVCYSVLHVKTHKLPTLECKTCSNRFHFDCLTQWFRSSGKSQCVLCQQPWQGTRVKSDANAKRSR